MGDSKQTRERESYRRGNEFEMEFGAWGYMGEVKGIGMDTIKTHCAHI